MELKMENKMIYTNHVSSKKVGYLKIKSEFENEITFERKDKLARICGVNSEFTVVVPSVNTEKHLSYVNLGPFPSLKTAKRAADSYLYEEGFVIFREDVIAARKEAINVRSIKS
jgi:hypothetical protein